MTQKTLMLGPLAANTYILCAENGRDAVVIDPGGGYKQITDALDGLSARPAYVLLTHAHYDHIGAVAALQKAGASVVMHKADVPLLSSGGHLADNFGEKLQPFLPDYTVKNGEIIHLAGLSFRVLHTPGHTAGSVSYLCDDRLYSGDTLFYLSVGRADLPTGDHQALKQSLTQLLRLDDGIKVYPGHGMATSVGYERGHNPYV